ncbi:MAG: Do family serine endopeptidase [Pseudomonadota bacterium]
MTKAKLFSRQFLLGAAASAVALGGVSQLSIAGAQAQAPKLLAPNAASVGAESIPDLVERVSPAVVSVMVEREVERPRGGDPFQEFFQFRFNQPFGEDPRGQREDEDEFEGGTERLQAQGSGFFIDGKGHVVTNHHVIDEADIIKIRLADGEELDAELVGADPLTDLAVLKVEPNKGQSFVEFADNVKLRVGETVVAIGNPFGLGGTVTSGIVSAIGGQDRQGQFLDFIQIDAPINRGNSGGPTFDLKGRVVGVNRAIYSPNGGSVGIGFAIPAKVAQSTVDQLISDGRVTRGWLGVELLPVNTSIAAALGRESTEGALVNNVLDGTPAAKAGLEPGDLITEIEGRAIESSTDLSRTVANYAPGEKVKVNVLRDGKDKIVNVTLGERDANPGQVDATPAANDNKDKMASMLGLRLYDLGDEERARFRVPDDIDGVVVGNVRRGSSAAEAGLRTGAVILEVEGQNVSSTDDLRKKIEQAEGAGKEAVFLRYQINGQKQFTALRLEGDQG